MWWCVLGEARNRQGGVVPVGAHTGAHDHREGVVWYGRSTSLGLPPPGNVVLPVC